MPKEPEEATTVHVRRAASGDTASISWLVERLSPVLVAQATWRLGPNLRRHADPEDLVADAWLRLLPKLHELPPRDGRYTPVLLRFLSTTILNRVNLLVKKHLRNNREPAPDFELEHAEAELTGVVSNAIRHEHQAELIRALSGLTKEDQEIVLLRGIEQRENQTVAELLNLTTAATAMRYHRALKRLRTELPHSVFADLDLDP